MENNEIKDNSFSSSISNNTSYIENREIKEYKDASWEQVSKDGHIVHGDSGIKFRNS